MEPTKADVFKLLSSYVQNLIDTEFFVNSLYSMSGKGEFDWEYTPDEERIMSTLQNKTNRFALSADDLVKNPGVYYTEMEIKVAALNAWSELLELGVVRSN